jgi:hypothetical protein
MDERGTREARGRWRSLRSLAILSGLVVVAGDWLLLGWRWVHRAEHLPNASDAAPPALGVNVAIYAAMLLVVTILWHLVGSRRLLERFGRRGLRTTLAAIVLIAALAIGPGWIAVALFAATLWWIARGLASGRAGAWPGRTADWFRDLAALPLELGTRLVRDNVLLARFSRRHPSMVRGRLAPMASVWAIPLAAAGIFAWLFYLANPVLEGWLNEAATAVGEWWHWLMNDVTAERVALWALFLAAIWTVLRVRRRPRYAEPPPRLDVAPSFDLRGAVTTRILVASNAVFLVQTALDLLYLTGGSALPPGMTYATYAHRGAYPLLAAALLAGAIVLWIFRPGSVAESSSAARRLVGLWIAQCILLTGTAAWRLSLYVEAYSLSRWRLATFLWLALVAIGLGLLIERIRGRRTHEWLLARLVVAGTAVLGVCAVLDLDGFIARYNVAHCREVGSDAAPVDLAYLRSLGESAIPALRSLAATSRDPAVAADADASAARLAAELERRLDDWRGWTVRRALLMREIAPHERSQSGH